MDKRTYLILFWCIFAYFLGAASQQDLAEGESDVLECSRLIDLMIVVDGSGSVRHQEFRMIKVWIKSFVQTLNIENGKVQIGVVQYSYWKFGLPLLKQPFLKTEIELGQFTNKTSFDEAVDKISHQGYTTHTAHAIMKTVEYDFHSNRSRYPEAARVLVLLTDGRSSDARDLPGALLIAKNAEVLMYAVGVGSAVNASELSLIVGGNQERMFAIQDFSLLGTINSQFCSALNKDILPKPVSTEEGSKGVDATQDCSRLVDLMILVDGSGSVYQYFPTMKSWIKQFAQSVNIEKRKVQIGVVQYSHWNSNSPLSEQPFLKTEIELGQFTNKTSFDKAVDQILLQGFTTNTAHAIMKTVEYDFQSTRSRYPEAARVLILLTDGTATDASYLPTAIQLAEDADVRIIALGIGEKANKEELLSIVGGNEQQIFNIQHFKQLESFNSRIYSTVYKTCDHCSSGYFKNSDTGECEKCTCDPIGTVNGSEECDQDTGKCTCASNVIGTRCDECADGFYGMSQGVGCKSCECFGSETPDCDKETGQCA